MISFRQKSGDFKITFLTSGNAQNAGFYTVYPRPPAENTTFMPHYLDINRTDVFSLPTPLRMTAGGQLYLYTYTLDVHEKYTLMKVDHL